MTSTSMGATRVKVVAGSAAARRSGGSSDYARGLIMEPLCWLRRHIPPRPLNDKNIMTAILTIMFLMLLLLPLLR